MSAILKARLPIDNVDFLTVSNCKVDLAPDAVTVRFGQAADLLLDPGLSSKDIAPNFLDNTSVPKVAYRSL